MAINNKKYAQQTSSKSGSKKEGNTERQGSKHISDHESMIKGITSKKKLANNKPFAIFIYLFFHF